MSHLITCHSLAKSFGSQTLFRDVDLVINSGDIIGLIGPNGSGKSTLLKILCGFEESDEGTLLANRNLQVGYLAQADSFAEELSVFENLRRSLVDFSLEEAEAQARVQEMLSRAEFADDNQVVASLSGGWRKRLAICRAFLARPDVLVLDEPTNHLDLEGILWLEKLLAGTLPGSPQAYVIVSHDRQFLQNCCNTIIELSAVYPQGTFEVDGSYADFLEKKRDYLQQQQQMEERLGNKLRRETEWLRRGPKARSTKAKYRIDEAHRLQERHARVKSRNQAGSAVGIDFDGTGRKTKKLLEATQLGKSFDGKVLFEGVDILLSPGSRLGLLGRNGCGKSTLLKTLAAGEAGAAQLDQGAIKTADKITIVEFEQNRDSLDSTLSLRRALAPEGDSVVFRDRSIHVVSWAKRFQFRADQLETPVGELSGGEQARILIASLMLRPADILLLDEPTNDLDIGSLDILEESLVDFPGALVLVTHDRYLLDRVCDRLLGFDGKGSTAYFADYQQWLDQMSGREEGQRRRHKQKPAVEKVFRDKDRSGKLSYLDQLEFDAMEKKIETAEERQQALQEKIESPEVAADPQRLQEYWQQNEEAKEEIERLYSRWSELEEKKLSS
mgnify:CR=1 FL=1